MTALHIVNRSPSEGRALATALALLRDGDALLLIEDGVIAAGLTPPALSSLSERKISLYALGPDLLARGLTAARRINVIDYTGFVELTTQYKTLRHWH